MQQDDHPLLGNLAEIRKVIADGKNPKTNQKLITIKKIKAAIEMLDGALIGYEDADHKTPRS